MSTATQAKVFSYDNRTEAEWKEFIEAMHGGEITEIDEELFDHFLDAVPPRFMGRTVKVRRSDAPRYVDFGFGEGTDPTVAFWRQGGRFFCQRMD